LTGRRDAGRDTVVEGEDGDSGFADGEGGRRDHGRKKPLEPLSRFGRLGRNARRSWMHLGADVMRDQAHNPLAVGGGHHPAAILQSARQAVDPQPAVRIEHHLDDRGVFKEGRDRRTEGSAQHARAAREGLRMEWSSRHDRPPSGANHNMRLATGMIRKGKKWGGSTRIQLA
jgi:hypothetical protein